MKSRGKLNQYTKNKKNLALYIEDNEDNQKLMRHIFKIFFDDMELKITNDAKSGLIIAKTYCPNLILMDIRLPDMTGIEATDILKREPGTQNIPVIAISSSAMANDIEAAKDVGFLAYLTKPIDVHETVAIIRAALTGDNIEDRLLAS